jgi:hypothetical protein
MYTVCVMGFISSRGDGVIELIFDLSVEFRELNIDGAMMNIEIINDNTQRKPQIIFLGTLKV